MTNMEKKRQFNTWANRNSDEDKLDIEGFLNPLVMQKYYEYMHKHRQLEDWTLRDADNWQNRFWDDHYSVCMKSLMRHVHDLWLEHRWYKSRDWIEDALNWIIFNAMAYAFAHYEDEYDSKR